MKPKLGTQDGRTFAIAHWMDSEPSVVMILEVTETRCTIVHEWGGIRVEPWYDKKVGYGIEKKFHKFPWPKIEDLK